MTRPALALALAVAVALTGLAASAPGTGAATTRSVHLKDIDIRPAVVRIHRGDRVRWLFEDSPAPHTVTSTGRPRFRSTEAKLKGTYTVRFTKSGTYRYRCTIHPSMTGKVVVR